jgi:class 3 adenylate cyclase
LPDLTDQDLKDLGVESLGHRRLLLRAITELKVEKDFPTAAAEVTPSAQSDSAERRQVTVMFSDLVGSTALSTRMDPEDLREVISAYQKCVAETVQRFGGFVAKYMGDGVLIYFGYPQAHEDDAERLCNAVRLGARSDEVEKLNQQLEQRVDDQVGEIERMGRLRHFLPPRVADLIVASGSEEQLESHRREITALCCDLRGFTGFTESADAEDAMALARLPRGHWRNHHQVQRHARTLCR